jgi:hypothetical protein
MCHGTLVSVAKLSLETTNELMFKCEFLDNVSCFKSKSFCVIPPVEELTKSST